MSASSPEVAPEPSRHERRRLRTRRDLLRATGELLVERGYEDLKIQDITDRADVARATFYVHFQHKQEAVWAVLVERFESFVGMMRADESLDVRERRHTRWVRIVEYAAAERPLLLVLLGDKGHPTLRKYVSDYLGAVLRAEIESGRVPRTADVPVVFEARFYVGAIMEVIDGWLRDDPRPEPTELADCMAAMILG
ncbi:MAG: TetR/AcrR family transcriptional regulator [Myxococcota bacterium]